MKRLAALLPITLLACIPETASSYEWRDGSEGWAMTCDSAEQCIRDARDACGGPYTVMSSRSEDYVRTTSHGSAYTNQWGFTSGSSSAESHRASRVHMLVKCRKKP